MRRQSMRGSRCLQSSGEGIFVWVCSSLSKVYFPGTYCKPHTLLLPLGSRVCGPRNYTVPPRQRCKLKGEHQRALGLRIRPGDPTLLKIPLNN